MLCSVPSQGPKTDAHRGPIVTGELEGGEFWDSLWLGSGYSEVSSQVALTFERHALPGTTQNSSGTLEFLC